MICALVTGVVYLLCANPSFYWLDSSELVAASWSLGVAHPPGHALAALAGRLFCYLPFGTIAFRVALASAFFAALGSGLVASLTRRWVEQFAAGSPRLASWAATVAGLTAGFSYAVAFQAVRAEVYALNATLIVASAFALWIWREKNDRRALLAAGLLAGLGLCNHHLLLLLAALPALLYLIFFAAKRSPSLSRRAWALLLLFTLFGLAPLAYLPLRARQQPRVNWGAPTTFERFTWVVSARAFQQSVDRAAKESVGHRAGGAIFAVLGGLSPVGGLLALAGLYLAARRRQSRGLAALLAGIGLFNLAGPLLVGFDPFNPDAHGYLAVAVMVFSPAIGFFVFVVARALQERANQLALLALAALLLPAYQLWHNGPRVDLRRHFAAETTGRALLDRPARAVLFTSYYQSLFQSWALQEAASLRPDITVVHHTFLQQPGYVENMALRHPDLAPLLRRAKAARRLVRADLEALAQKRPVLIEPDEMVPRDLWPALRPAGLLLRLGGGTASDTKAHWRRIDDWQRVLATAGDNETKRALIWAHYRLAAWACGSGRAALGRAHLARIRRLAPKARDVESLARHCGP